MLPMFFSRIKLDNIIRVAGFFATGLTCAILPLFLKPMIVIGIFAGLAIFMVIMHNPKIGLVLTAVTIPLEMAGRVAALTQNLPLTIPKIMTFLTLISFLLHYANRRIKTRKLPLARWLLFFLAAAILSLIGAEETRFGIEAVFRFLTTIVFFFLVVQLADSRAFFRKCLVFFVLAMTLAALFAIMQRYLPESRFEFRSGWEDTGALRFGVEKDTTEERMVGIVERSSGVSAHSIILALNISIVLASVVAFFRNLQLKNPERYFWLMVMIILLCAVVVTYSRTGLMLVAFSFFLIFFRKLLRLNTVIVMAFIFLLAILFIAAPKGYFERVLSIESYTMKSRSITIRLEAQNAAFEQFMDHPLMGAGYGNRYGIFDYYTSYPDKKHFLTPHQAYLQLASQTGIIGLVLLCIFFVQLHKHTRKAARRFSECGDYDMARIGESLNIGVLTFLFSGLALDLFDKGMAQAWFVIGMSGAYILLSNETADLQDYNSEGFKNAR